MGGALNLKKVENWCIKRTVWSGKQVGVITLLLSPLLETVDPSWGPPPFPSWRLGEGESLWTNILSNGFIKTRGAGIHVQASAVTAPRSCSDRNQLNC